LPFAYHPTLCKAGRPLEAARPQRPFAGGPGTNPDDVKFIDDQLKILLGT